MRVPFHHVRVSCLVVALLVCSLNVPNVVAQETSVEVDPEVVAALRDAVIPAVDQFFATLPTLHVTWDLVRHQYHVESAGDETSPSTGETAPETPPKDTAHVTFDWQPDQGQCLLKREKPGMTFVAALNPEYRFVVASSPGESEYLLRSGQMDAQARLNNIDVLMQEQGGQWITTALTRIFSGTYVAVIPIKEMIQGRPGYEMTAARWIDNEGGHLGHVEWICNVPNSKRDIEGATYWADFDPSQDYLVVQSGRNAPTWANTIIKTEFERTEFGLFPSQVTEEFRTVEGELFHTDVLTRSSPPQRSELGAEAFRLPSYGISETALKPVAPRVGWLQMLILGLLTAAVLLFLMRQAPEESTPSDEQIER